MLCIYIEKIITQVLRLDLSIAGLCIFLLNAMTGIAQRMVDNNLGPDGLAGPKALGLMTGIVQF